MPTAVLTTLIQALEASVSPLFVPLLYVGVFTIMVLIARPWTLR
ncbi:hypothetical protein [uncultured Caulobacter sp.]|nr:hypothetical protein [uncultured Caulobacter sp.]